MWCVCVCMLNDCNITYLPMCCLYKKSGQQGSNAKKRPWLPVGAPSLLISLLWVFAPGGASHIPLPQLPPGPSPSETASVSLLVRSTWFMFSNNTTYVIELNILSCFNKHVNIHKNQNLWKHSRGLRWTRHSRNVKKASSPACNLCALVCEFMRCWSPPPFLWIAARSALPTRARLPLRPFKPPILSLFRPNNPQEGCTSQKQAFSQC